MTVLTHSSHCSRILMVPMPQKSHQLMFVSLAKELISQENEVYVYMGETMSIVDQWDSLNVT